LLWDKADVGSDVNNDAIVVGSSNVLVQNSFAHNADDGFQIKSWQGNPVTSVVFRNNIIWSTVGGGFVIPCVRFSLCRETDLTDSLGRKRFPTFQALLGKTASFCTRLIQTQASSSLQSV
jgi:hypothetical protein